MTEPLTVREQVVTARRIVVKVGSSSISGANVGQIGALVDALAAAHARGAEVILVSSGAIATGIPFLKLNGRPSDLATQQAAAAVGQNILIFRYQESLRRYSIVAGQLLLTAGDLENPTSHSNAQRALERLLALRILPIVNENDTVATHEIRFGDNDRLASLVAELARADLLVLLSDVDALYTRPPARAGRGEDQPGCRSTTTSPASSSETSARPAWAPGEREPRSRRPSTRQRTVPRCCSPRRRRSPRRWAASSSAPGSRRHPTPRPGRTPQPLLASDSGGIGGTCKVRLSFCRVASFYV